MCKPVFYNSFLLIIVTQFATIFTYREFRNHFRLASAYRNSDRENGYRTSPMNYRGSDRGWRKTFESPIKYRNYDEEAANDSDYELDGRGFDRTGSPYVRSSYDYDADYGYENSFAKGRNFGRPDVYNYDVSTKRWNDYDFSNDGNGYGIEYEPEKRSSVSDYVDDDYLELEERSPSWWGRRTLNGRRQFKKKKIY